MTPTLYWHGLGPGHFPTARFTDQLHRLVDLGLRPTSLGDALSAGGVALTFDDGLTSCLTEAAPVLEAVGARATVFVISGRVGKPGYLDLAGLRALQDRGWEIGAHGHTHVRLPWARDLHDETAGARARLEQWLDTPVVRMAYPYGAWSPRAVRAVRAAGYVDACTTIPGYRAWSALLRPRFLADGPDWLSLAATGRGVRPRALWRAVGWKLGLRRGA